MTKEDIEPRVGKLVMEITGKSNPPALTDRLVEDLKFDSIDCIEGMIALEEIYGIPEIAYFDGAKWKTVGDVVDYIVHATAETPVYP